jgi:hypothetical protein
MTHEREPDTLEDAIRRAIELLGDKRCAAATGYGVDQVRKAGHHNCPSHALAHPRAIRLDRALMMAPQLAPEERQPLMLLAHAAELGLDITWRSREAAPPADSINTLLFRLVELVGQFGGMAGQAEPLDADAVVQLARSRERLTAITNQILDAARAAGTIDEPTHARLRVVGGTEA